VKTSKRIFKEEINRYTVEILEVATGERRLLPLTGEISIPLINDAEEPKRLTKESLVVRDGEETLRAETFEELREQLRARYPDGLFERRLHVEQDRQAEERWEEGIRLLAELVADGVAREMWEDVEGRN
jgi:hypothetical protein